MQQEKHLKYDLIKGPKDTPVTLGFGSFGTVKLAKCRQTGQIVALKLIYNRNALSEVEHQRHLSHPNIVRILDASYDKERHTTLIVMEYVNNGTLFESIHEGTLTKPMVKRVFYQVCKAVAYLHEQGIMHRDIKPENILLTKNGLAKLCDFGFAAETDSPRKTLCGTYEYMSPEMAMGEPYTQKNDIWSLGILLFELIEGTAPFKGSSREQILASMKRDIYFSTKFTEQEISLLHSILRVNPYNRPQVIQMLKHPYFLDEPFRVSTFNKNYQDFAPVFKPRDSGRIKLVEVKIVKTEQNRMETNSEPMRLSSANNLKHILSRYKDTDSNMLSTASNSICEKREKISLKGRRS